MEAYYQKNQNGSFDIILYVSAAEMALDFSALKKLFFPHAEKMKRVALIRCVKIVIGGTLVLSIPFSFFAKVGASERYAMSYVYYGSGEAQIESVKKAEETLSVVSPSYFNLEEDGTLSLSGISKSFIEKMHASGVRVVPFLSNHWDRGKGVRALQNRETLVREIVEVVNAYGLDGVNVDIENVTETERAAYTDLVRRLRTSLPASKEVSVAVAANPWGSEKGWAGSYDYAALAAYADHLFIMAYDEHYQGGEAGAVASLPFVEKSIQYALTQAPPEKLVLGIPFYGRIWGEGLSGYGISMQKIQEYAAKYQTEIQYNANTHTPILYLTIKSGEAGPTVGGKRLTAGKYVIHYENSDSIKAKLALVSKYNLKGAGNWSAGQETADVWDYYQLWLDGDYFSDISNHFAKDEILRITADGIMQGQGEDVFAPAAPLTRAEVAAISARLLHLPDGNGRFLDVPVTHWAYSSILKAEKADLMRGYPDGTFRPDAPVSRAEMAVLLARMIEESFVGESDFPDVQKGHWAENEIAALANMGILSGYPNGTFRPENKISRGEAAVILERIQKWL